MKTTLMSTAIALATFLTSCAPVEIAVSDDGTMAYYSERGFVAASPDGRVTCRFDVTTVPMSIAISRDGGRVCYAVYAEPGEFVLLVRGLDNDTPVEVARGRGVVRYPRWSVDGAWIGYVVDRYGVIENPQEVQDLSLHAVRLNPDSSAAEHRLVLENSGLWHDWSADNLIVATRTRAGKRPVDLERATLVTATLDGALPTPRAEVMGGDFSYLRFDREGRTIHFCAPIVEYPAAIGRTGARKPSFAHFAFTLASETLIRRSPPTEQVFCAIPSPTCDDVVYVAADHEAMFRGRVFLRDGHTQEVRKLGISQAEVMPFFVGADHVGFVTKNGDDERIVVRDLEGNPTSIGDHLPALAPPIITRSQ